jgi:hypothetical protein
MNQPTFDINRGPDNGVIEQMASLLQKTTKHKQTNRIGRHQFEWKKEQIALTKLR